MLIHFEGDGALLKRLRRKPARGSQVTVAPVGSETGHAAARSGSCSIRHSARLLA